MPLIEQGLGATASNGEHRVFSSFFSDNHIIQQVAIVQPKNLVIQGLRNIFANDSVYTYRSDIYGFPLTPDLTGSDVDATTTTKISISDLYRYEVKFFPAIVIKSGGGSYKPLSFNQEGTYKYRKEYTEDSNGKRTIITTPTHKVYAGRWELSFDIQIYSESHTELQELVDITSIALQYNLWQDLRAAGLLITRTQISGESAEAYANDYVYNQNISISTLSEWRVEIPIENVIEKLVFYFDSVKTPDPGVATEADVMSLNLNDILDLTKIE